MPNISGDDVPAILSAMSVTGIISNSIHEAALCNKQLKVLSECSSKLLGALDAESRSNRIHGEKAARQLEDLHRQVVLLKLCNSHATRILTECRRSLLMDISHFVQQQSKHDFIKSLFLKDNCIRQIKLYHQQIAAWTASFQVSVAL